ncbi:MAG: DUF5615 family PIN-like protein [Nitrospira sp.]|nr:DUF5615 family PIN-like protein [Nitrospira sp.]
MRLLLDESVPRRFREALPTHTVKTVVDMGWGGMKNGALLARAAEEFEVFITVDQNLPYQQHQATLPLAVIVLLASSNKLQALLPLVPRVEAALTSLKPRSLVQIQVLQ